MNSSWAASPSIFDGGAEGRPVAAWAIQASIAEPDAGETMPTVLVLDDDPATLSFAQRALEAAGYRVRTSTSAGAALEVLACDPVDAVVLEMILPEKEGVETIIEIKRRWPARAVVAMSGGGVYVSAGVVLRLAEFVGAGAALHKPFSATELLAAVDRVLSGCDA